MGEDLSKWWEGLSSWDFRGVKNRKVIGGGLRMSLLNGVVGGVFNRAAG